jgi:hypothetical protein
MWDQYLEFAINTTQEVWPLLGTLMLILIIPLMMFRVGRHSYLAATGVKQLNSKVEELQNIVEELRSADSASSEVGPDIFTDEAQKQTEAEKVSDAFANTSQADCSSQEVASEMPQENVALANAELSFDGNLAVEQPEYIPPVKEQASPEMLQPQKEAGPELAPTQQAEPEEVQKPEAAVAVPEKKDRNIVQCSKCGNKLAYKGEWSGRKVKCPSCKDVLALP